MLHRHNPFSTCYTAPGCMPYLVTGVSCSTETLCPALHHRWLRQHRVGAIVGPHGAGKSSLVASLQQAWSAEYGYQVVKLTLHNGQRTLPREFWKREHSQRGLVIVDGYEQLGWLARWRLNAMRRQSGCGLLVTTHLESRLPTLYRVEPSFETLLAVVRQLLAPQQDTWQSERFIDKHALRAWQETGANARETLFRLYDCWEQESGDLRICADDSGQHDASDSAARFVSSY